MPEYNSIYVLDASNVTFSKTSSIIYLYYVLITCIITDAEKIVAEAGSGTFQRTNFI